MFKPIQARNTAWKFLRKNPDYINDWHHLDTTPTLISNTRAFKIYEQRQSDLPAEKWGLLTYEDPIVEPENIAPFWSITPILEAEVVPNEKSALIPMLRKTGAAISGLLLLDGDLILKAVREGVTAQVRIKNGQDFNETSGLILHLPLDLMLPVRLTRSLDFWNIAVGEQFKKVENQIKRIMMNFYSFSMACSLERATAK